MIRMLLLAGTAAAALSGAAHAATIYALRDDARLITIDSATRKATADVAITGATGVMSIAVRPADGKIYGLTSAGEIVRIDPRSGAAAAVSRLDKKLETGPRAAISFNPTVDRLRVIGPAGNNYRLNVDTGAVTIDGGLKYQASSALSGTTPTLTAAAYTNSFAGTKETALYTIDPTLAQLNLQAPPNDGVQQMKGALGSSPPYGLGFAILSDGQGGNEAYAVHGAALHRVDLASGKIASLGPIAGIGTGEVLAAAIIR